MHVYNGGGFVSGKMARGCESKVKAGGFKSGIMVRLLDGSIETVERVDYKTGDVFIKKGKSEVAYNFTALTIVSE